MQTSGTVSHDRKDESIEAKALWFQSLSIEERMELFCELTDMALSLNPSLTEKKNAEPTSGRIQIISRT